MHFSMKNGSVIRNKYSTGRKRIKVNVFSYRESVQLFLAFSSDGKTHCLLNVNSVDFYSKGGNNSTSEFL